MFFISAEAAESAFDWSLALDCIRQAYATEISDEAIPGRLVASDESAWIRCMPAIPVAGRFMGTKQISRTRDGKVTYVISLYDKSDGRLACLIDGMGITAMRTAATSAVALSLLSDGGPVDLAVLGSGLEARTHVQAAARVADIRSVTIYSPTVANRQRFAADVAAQLNVPAKGANSPEEAVSGATHVIAAARSRDEEPILLGEWLSEDAVVVSIGSTTPSQREIDISVVRRAGVIVSDVPDEVAHDTGDMIAAAKAGISFEDKLFSLQDLSLGRIPRSLCGGIRLFKSVGSALQDVALAEQIALRAISQGQHTPLSVEIGVKQSIGRNLQPAQPVTIRKTA